MSVQSERTAVSAESVAWGALLFAVFVTPLAMTDFGWLGIEQPLTSSIYTEAKVFVLRASALVAFAGWIWAVLVDGRPLRRTRLDLWVLGFVAWLGVSTAFSIHPLTSVFGHYTRSGGLLTYVLYAALFFLVVQFADKGSRVLALAKAVFWSGMIVSAYGVLQYLGIDWVRDVPASLVGRAYSTLGNPGVLGSQLVYVLPLSAALALTERRMGWRVAYWSGTLLSAIALMATFSRSAWIGGALALALLAAYAIRHRVKMERSIDLPFAAFSVLAVMLGIWRSVAASDQVTNVFARLGDLLDFESGSGFSRVGLWRAAIDATMDRPVTGFGLDTFRLFSPSYFASEYARTGDYLAIPDNAHSYPLQLVSTAGVLGLALFLAVIAMVGWTSARKTLAVPRGSAGTAHILLAAFWAASAGYVVNLFASISMPNTTFMLWVSMAVLMAPSAWERPLKAPASGRAIAVVAAGLCLALAVAAVVPLRADNRYLAGTTLPDLGARIAAADAAVRLAPYYDTYRTSRAVLYADPVINAARSAGGPQGPNAPQVRAELDAALEQLNAVREFSPWEPDGYVLSTVMYNVGGRYLDPAYYDEAIRIAEEGLERSLHAPDLRLQYAIALEGAGRTADARRELETLIELEPRMAEAAVQLARIYVAEDQAPQAVVLLRSADATVLNRALIANALGAAERGEPIPSVAW